MGINEDKLENNLRLRVLGHISSVMNGILVTLVVIPILAWNLLTTFELAKHQNSIDERLANHADAIQRLQTTADKIDDRVRVLEIQDASNIHKSH